MLTIISFFINIWRIIEILKDLISNIKTMPILLSILLVVLVGMQLLVFVKYGHINDDDAYYVATATTSVQTDTLFKYSAMTGTDEIDEQYLMRYRLGPFPIYYAIMSKVIDIHPAIVAHQQQGPAFSLRRFVCPEMCMVPFLHNPAAQRTTTAPCSMSF